MPSKTDRRAELLQLVRDVQDLVHRAYELGELTAEEATPIFTRLALVAIKLREVPRG